MIYDVHCTYCGMGQEFEFVPSSDFSSMDDVIEHNYEQMCRYCGCPFRISEGLSDETKQKLGVEIFVSIPKTTLEEWHNKLKDAQEYIINQLNYNGLIVDWVESVKDDLERRLT